MDIKQASFKQKLINRVGLPTIAYFLLTGCASNPIKNFTEADIRAMHTQGSTIVHRALKREAKIGLKVQDQYYKEFKELAKEAKDKIVKLGLHNKDKYTLDEAFKILGVFGEVVDKKYPYDHDGYNIEGEVRTFIELFNEDLSVCFQRPFLFIALSKTILKTPLPLSIVEAPGHTLLRLSLEGEDPVNWETTAFGADRSRDDEYYTKYRLSITDDELVRGNYLRALEKEEIIAMHLASIAGFLDRSNQTQKAIDCCSLALLIDPKSIQALNQRGILLGNLGYFDEAKSDFDLALVINPDNPAVLRNSAEPHYRLGNYDQALKNLTRTIELKDDDDVAYGNRAVIYMDLGKKDLARQDLEKAIELNPREILYKKALQSLDASIFWRIGYFLGLN